ncbi:MAG: hypothetical protein J0H99_07115 [Rhodospirillales bacterium]|nr:hypothetical protein [Rhodospirillales bacterium]
MAERAATLTVMAGRAATLTDMAGRAVTLTVMAGLDPAIPAPPALRPSVSRDYARLGADGGGRVKPGHDVLLRSTLRCRP